MTNDQSLRRADLEAFAEKLDSKLARVIELTAALDGKVTALDGKVAALDGKVAALDGKVAVLDGKVAALGHQMTVQAEQTDGKLIALEERLRENVHDTETALLRSFHKYADAHNLRAANLELFQSTATKRLADVEGFDKWASLEVRVLEIEKRLHMNR